jgi:hypothetical protein
MPGRNYPEEPGWQNRDTSYEAALSVDAAGLRGFVVSLLKSAKNMTDDEIDQHKPPNCPTLRPRRCELTASGVVIPSGVKRFSKKGRLMIAWMLRPPRVAAPPQQLSLFD